MSSAASRRIRVVDVLVLTGIVLLGGLLKLWSFERVHAMDPTRIVSSDTPRYEEPALSLIADGDMQDGLSITETQDLHVTPLYPIAIAGVYALAGSADRASLVRAQIALSLLSVVLLFFIVRAIGTTRAGLVAAALFAVEPMQFLYSQIILSETLFVFVMMIVLWTALSLLRDYEHPRRRLALAAGLGLAVGVASLVRPIAYYLVFCFAIGLLLHHLTGRHRPHRVLAPLALLLGCFMLVVAPWHIRNGQVSGSYVFTDNPGEILYYWKAGGMVAYRDGRDPKSVRLELAASMPSSYESAAERIALEHERGMELLRSDLPSYARFTLDGIARILIGPGVAKFGRYYGGEDGGSGASGGYAPWFLAIMFWSLAFLALVYVAFPIGVVRFARGRTHVMQAALAVGLVAYFVLASAGHSAADSRMRLPAMPMFVAFAALALAGRSRADFQEQG